MHDAALAATASSWPEHLRSIAAEYAGLDVTGLEQALKGLIVGTVEHVVRMACVLRLLEEHGRDLGSLQTPMLDDLRRVAYGQLLPGVLLAGNSNRRLLNVARSLPLPDQSLIANDEPIPVVVFREGVGPEPRLVPPSKMDTWQLRQVFARGRRRSEVEQINFLDNPKHRRKARGLGVVVDRKQRRLVVSGENVVITASQLAEYLREFTK